MVEQERLQALSKGLFAIAVQQFEGEV